MRGLAGKTALITGAGRGIGRAIAERLYREGANVAIIDRDPSAAEQARTEILSAQGGSGAATVLAFGCDALDPAAVSAVFDQVQARIGVPQLLVNNVGGSRDKRPLAAMNQDALMGSFALNVGTLVLATQEFARRLSGTGLPGAIVNLSSSAAVRPKGGRFHYTGGKAAVSAITQSLAMELASSGIRVNAVCPGPTMTDDIRRRFADPATRKAEEDRQTKIPMGRLAEAEDIANVVAFLLSDDAAYVTGVLLPVDGGYTVAT